MASDAAPHLKLPPDDEPASPTAERLVRVREVAADLEAIFGQPAHVAVAAPRARAQVASRRSAPAGTMRWPNLASVGVVSAAALAGVAIGSLLARVPQFAHTSAPVAIDSLLARAPEFTPAPVDIRSLLARVPRFAPTSAHIRTLLARVPQFDRAPAPAESEQQPEPPLLASLPMQALPPLQEPQTVDAPRVTPPAPTRLGPATLKPKRRAARAPVRTAHPPRASHACCAYAEVDAADRRLRDAYDEAVRSGVPRGEIMAARDRWSVARRRGVHDPLGLVADYRDIADDLNRASRRASSRVSEGAYAREDSGRFQPRYAAWWR